MRLGPQSLTGQLALLVFGAFVLAQAISLWLFTDERGRTLQDALRLETAERSAAVVLALEAAPMANRAGILQAARTAHTDFHLSREALVANDAPTVSTVRSKVEILLPQSSKIRVEEIGISPRSGQPMNPPAPLVWLKDRMLAAGLAPVELRLSIRLSEGGWLNVRASNDRPDFQIPPVILGTILLSLALIMGTLWYGLRRITGPLRLLADAAEDFGIDSKAPDMPKGGPEEVQALSDALGRMQTRISAMVADRTRMLAALGHDLRSPITALRLRAEMVEDDETRERMVATLDEMRDMVEATLAYARGVSADQPTEPVDLTLLLAELTTELADTGPKISIIGGSRVTLSLRRTPIRRALRNLLENAQRYGGRVEVTLRETSQGVEITIDDHGPGIAEESLDRVFDPYTRLEASRSRDTGGIGLGLPIARAILRAHGGDVGLSNRPEGGLRALVWLPK
ncbi:ATP-binding protein [Tabrizicola sp.]|uniref:ATP-binding protein n=1 Tax=Tabrizicola sp. TaxID=2005166 RepID=UPI00261C57BB|nr:ATP-binding protein [Tabrizicola sp.]MDM7931488.1 ATP-binding protein [Tabrizicola sp.]